MKKALYTMLIVVVGLLAFVGCSPQSSVSDELVSATLISTDRTSRALVHEVSFDINNVKAWRYTATKADGGLTTGQTTELKQLKDAATGQEVTKGSLTHSLSQGSWNFTLYGYSDENAETLICKGTASNKLVTADKTAITITVKPTQSENGMGKISISDDIKIVSEDGETTYSGDEYTMSYEVYRGTANKDTDVTSDVKSNNSLDVGSYTVVITFKGTEGSTEYVAATAERPINVYDNLTTTVSGTVNETVKSALLTGEGIIVAEKSETISEDKTDSFGLSMTVDSTPVGSGETTIVFPDSSLTMESGNTNRNVKLTVKSTTVEKSSSTYTVESDNSPVAGLDLSLEGATIGSMEEGSGISITTYIATGLDESKLNIVYNGVESEGQKSATKTSYDPTTGKLVFMVYHFSEYFITTTENIAYDETSLRYEINAVPENGENATEIKLIDNVNLEATILISEGRNVNVNLNGHNISSTANINVLYIAGGHLELTGKGTIKGSENYTTCGIYIRGSSDENATKFSTAKIGSDVTLSAFYGIGVLYDNSVDVKTYGYHAYGVEVTMNGKYVGETKTNYANCFITVNGSIKDNGENIPKITIQNATVTKGNIYAAGYAKWNISNCNIIGQSTAIEIRAGEMDITSGSFKSTATPASTKANGNGATTRGAAIAVVQHTTRLPISVKISGGEFEGYHALAVLNPEKSTSVQLKDVKVTVTGGSFTATGTKAEGGSVDVVNVDSEFFVISENPIYASNASFTVTAKTE